MRKPWRARCSFASCAGSLGAGSWTLPRRRTCALGGAPGAFLSMDRSGSRARTGRVSSGSFAVVVLQANRAHRPSQKPVAGPVVVDVHGDVDPLVRAFANVRDEYLVPEGPFVVWGRVHHFAAVRLAAGLGEARPEGFLLGHQLAGGQVGGGGG